MKNRAFLVERSLLVVGAILAFTCVAALVHRRVSSRLALRAFDQAQAASTKGATRLAPTQGDETVDFSLWSEKRVRAYKESLLIEKTLPWGVLSIDKLQIRVPVFDGTGDLVLNRGVGRIIGTARHGEAGNIGIAGHRDGFFRGLKDVAVGDLVDLLTPHQKASYIVEHIDIVSPDDVGVLRPGGSPALTLVTCYPFYFIGDAPQRFIVHATLRGTVAAIPVQRMSLKQVQGPTNLKENDND